VCFGSFPDWPLGGIYHLRFDPSGVSLGMTIDLPQHPEECYAVNLNDFSCDRWTTSSMGGLDTGTLIPAAAHTVSDVRPACRENRE